VQGENNSTFYKVCDTNIAPNINNWLWTPFIEGRRDITFNVGIRYHIKSCYNVQFCKEEFVLFLHESDTATIQDELESWESKDYTELKEIGWLRRNDRSIEPFGTNKKGFYLAIRDQGSCLSISSIKVYYYSCPEATIDFLHLPETFITHGQGKDFEVEGECVPNAVPLYGLEPRPKRKCEYYWIDDSEWNEFGSEVCRCKAGYQPDPIKNNTCIVCPVGKFKPLPGGDECLQCPPYTKGLLPGLDECPCIEGYYRSEDESAYEMCSRPLSSPTNLTSTKVYATTATLSWSPPLDEGNRTDTRYRVSCDTCGSWVTFNPGDETFQETSVTIENLYPETSYRFLVFSENGVSDLVEEEAKYAEIIVVTTESNPVLSKRVKELEHEVEDWKQKVEDWKQKVEGLETRILQLEKNF